MKVFLHGFMGDPLVWRAFRGEGDLAPTLLGHGSEHNEGVTCFEDEVARLVHQIEAAGLSLRSPGIHLIGYSLGARLALGIAARIRLERLTLVSGRDGLKDAEARRERLEADEIWARRFEACETPKDFEEVLALWDAQPVFNTPRPALLQRRLAHDPKQLASCLRTLSLGRMPVYAERIQCDMIEIISGAKDPKFCALGEALALTLGATYRVLPGAGHDLPTEAPEALERLLSQGFSQGDMR